jgi:hypothetical protein
VGQNDVIREKVTFPSYVQGDDKKPKMLFEWHLGDLLKHVQP